MNHFLADDRGLETIEWVGIGVVLLALAVIAYAWLGQGIQSLANQILGLF